jgi:BirA family transcriptional regulator, biotin operon repressor / biotin---[acetyl-CoA-carboxylase] ligase
VKKIIGNNIIHLQQTNSTNSFAIELVRKGRPVEGTIVIADFQTRGKGLDNNYWESESGENLTFTIVLYPKFLQIEKQFGLNKVIALGVYDFVRQKVSDQKVSIKWPNDIYIGNNKVCGILIQNSITGSSFDYIIAGIGLNLNQLRFSANIQNPVSLRNITGKKYSIIESLKELSNYLNERYLELKLGHLREIDNDYLNVLYRFGQWNNFELGGKIYEAQIIGLSDYGQLIVETREKNIHECNIKDIKFIL